MAKVRNDYIIQFDGLRFIAIFMVMIAHWAQWQFSHPIIQGFPFSSGVILFFVLSGFLITNILITNKTKYENNSLNKKQLIKSFYIRRVIRIFPIYYLSIFLLYLINYENAREMFPWLISYSSNIYQSINNIYVGNFNHFWSLAVEEQFYLFWPWLMIFIPTKHLEKTIVISIIVSIVLKIYIYFFIHKWMANSYFTLCNLNSLGLGALFAYWSVYRKNYIRYFLKSYWIIGVVVVYFGLYYYTYYKNISWYKEIVNEPLFAVLSVAIINYASKNKFTGVIKWFLERKLVIYAGKISYGMYVYHLFIPSLFWYLAPKIGISVNNGFIVFIVYFLLTFFVSVLSWKLIEKPINNLKTKYPYIKKTI